MIRVQTKSVNPQAAQELIARQQALLNKAQAPEQKKSVKPTKVSPQSVEGAYARFKPASLKLSPGALARNNAAKVNPNVSRITVPNTLSSSEAATKLVSQALTPSSNRSGSGSTKVSSVESAFAGLKKAGEVARNNLQVKLQIPSGTPDDSHLNSSAVNRSQKSAA